MSTIRADHSLDPARALARSGPSQIIALSGGAVPLVLLAEAPSVSSLRSSPPGVDCRHSELQDSCWCRHIHSCQQRDRFLLRSLRVDALCRNDGIASRRPDIYSLPEHCSAESHRTRLSISPGRTGMHMGYGLLQKAQRRVGLDTSWFPADAGIGRRRSLLMVHGPGRLNSGNPAWCILHATEKHCGPRACRCGHRGAAAAWRPAPYILFLPLDRPCVVGLVFMGWELSEKGSPRSCDEPRW